VVTRSVAFVDPFAILPVGCASLATGGVVSALPARYRSRLL